MKTTNTCTTDGCDKPVYIKKRGLCKSCYGKFRREEIKRTGTKCMNPECHNVAMNKNTPSYCWTCYNRMRFQGTTEDPLAFRENKSKKEILDYIILYKSTHDGLSPTVREIAAHVKESYVLVIKRLNSMADDGVINYLDRKRQDNGWTISKIGRSIMLSGGRWMYAPSVTNARNTPNEDAE